MGRVKNANIRIFSPEGRIVYQRKNIQTASHFIELREASGIYFVEISAANKIKSYKLILK
jgi:hypothetical protein